MRIQHNIMAMNAYRNYNNNIGSLSSNLEKLSSGYRINRAGDDAAGLAISEKMRAQITGLDAAQKNVKDGVSLVKTAEGAMQEIQDMMNRMKYLAVQSANGTYDNEVDRANLQKEVDALKNEINRIADSANFNGQKLLDGSLESTQLSEVPVEFNTQTITDGLTINEAQNGGGAAGEFTMDITGMFGTGDTVTIDFSSITDKTLTFNTAGGANTFKGETAAEQAQSIADALNADAAVSQKFTVTAEGSSIKLVNKEEGATGKEVVNGFTVADKTVTVPNGALTAGAANGTTAKTTVAGFTTLFNGKASTGGVDLKEGDVLTFTFKGSNEEELTAKVTVTNDMIGADTKTTTANIAAALSNTTFEKNDTTVFAEEKFKVSDFFTVTANSKATAAAGTKEIGSLNFAAVKDGQFNVAKVQLNGNDVATAETASGVTIGGAGTAHEYEVAAGTGNFTKGDVIELSGALSDGRTFTIKLTAGEDFDIGTDYAATAGNIVSTLNSADFKVTLSDGTEVSADKIFDASTGDEIKVENTTGKLTFTSNKKGVMGAGVAGGITNVSVTTADAAAVEETLTAGVDQSAATSSLTFSEGLEYGTTVTIDGKNYELVQDSRDVSNRNNVAVVVSDLTNVEDVAAQLTAAVQGEAGYADADFTIAADGATVTLSTKDVGSDVQAVGISTPYGEEVTTASFKFDTDVVEEGSVFKFNDNTYEFVKAGEKATNPDAIAIEVADFESATAKELGDAFQAVAKNGIVSVADDGAVTLKGIEGKDGTISKPTISFGENLTLQIGDTADSYNQLKVGIADMHVDALGIGDLNIGSLKGAQEAVDLISEAINKVSSTRGDLGAIQNRLEHTQNNLSVMEENIQDAESTIRDTDVADEMMAYTKNNILIQSAQAMLAQANQVPQGVLQLLQ